MFFVFLKACQHLVLVGDGELEYVLYLIVLHHLDVVFIAYFLRASVIALQLQTASAYKKVMVRSNIGPSLCSNI